MLVAGRLGAAAGPAVGLVAFLFWPGAADAGRLVGAPAAAAAAATGLVFAAAGFAAEVEAEGFVSQTHAYTSYTRAKERDGTNG